MPNPLKNLLKTPQVIFSPVGGLIDKAKILELNLSVGKVAEPGKESNDNQQTTAKFLKEFGFSDQIIELFFKPFFGGVFLEKDLATHADFFKFLFSMFASGNAAMPATQSSAALFLVIFPFGNFARPVSHEFYEPRVAAV